MNRPNAARPFGSTPVLIVFTTLVPVILETVPAREFESHTDPNPAAMSYGPDPTRTVAVTFAVDESMRTAVERRLSTAQTAPGTAARLKTRIPTGTWPSTAPDEGSMRTTSPWPSPPAQSAPPAATSPN